MFASLLAATSLLTVSSAPAHEHGLQCGWDPNLRIANRWEDPHFRPGAPVFGINDDTNNQFLAGKVAISVVFVESDGSIDPNQDDWTQQERDFAMQTVKDMEDRFVELAPAQAELQFIRNPAMNPITVTTGYEPVAKHHTDHRDNGQMAEWTADVFEKLGSPKLGADWGSVQRQARKLNVQIRNSLNADFSIFILCMAGPTPYSMAYGEWASNGGASSFDANARFWHKKVFMHELAHCFGTAHCTPGPLINGGPTHAGFLGYFSGESSPPCIMGVGGPPNGDDVCWFNHVPEGNRGQLGWTDLDQDGVLDILDTHPEIEFRTSGMVVSDGLRHRLYGGPKLAFRQRIASARTRVKGGSWKPIAAADGAFDSALEALNPGDALGAQYFVRARNQYGNENAPVAVSNPSIQLNLNTTGVPYVHFSVDGRYLAFHNQSNEETKTQVADLATGKVVRTLDGYSGCFWQGQLVVNRWQEIVFYNPADWTVARRINPPYSNVWMMKPVAGGQLLAVSYGEGRTLLYKPGQSTPWKTLPIASFQIEVSQDLSTAYTSTWNSEGKSLKWNLADLTSQPWLTHSWIRFALGSDETAYYQVGRWLHRLRKGATEPDLVVRDHEDYIESVRIDEDRGIVALLLANGQIVLRRLSDFAPVSGGAVPTSGGGNVALGPTHFAGVSGKGFRAFLLPPRFTFEDRAGLVSVDVAGPLKSGAPGVGTVTLDRPAPPGGLEVGISWDEDVMSGPETVFVPANATSANFQPIGAVTGTTRSGAIYAQVGSRFIGKPVTVRPARLQNLSLTTSALSGGSMAATVSLDGVAPEGGLTVALSGTGWTVPSNIVVPAGAQSRQFTLKAPNVGVATTIQLRATLGTDSFTKSAQIQPAQLSTVLCLPNSVEAGKGGNFRVRLNGTAPPGGAKVDLTKTSTAVGIPASVTLPEGTTYLDVPFTTSSTAAKVVASLTATYRGVSRSASLTITPMALNAFYATPTSVTGGTKVTLTIGLTRAAPPEGAVVELKSDKAQLQVPKSAKVAAGKTSVQVQVSTLPTAANVVGTLTATFRGKSLAAKVTVLAPRLASFTSNLATVAGGSTAVLRLSVSLTGPAPAGGLAVPFTTTHSSIPAGRMTVPAGSKTHVQTVSHLLTPTTVSNTLRATAGGVARSVAVQVVPVTLTGFTLAPSSVRGGSTLEIRGTLSHALRLDGRVTLTYDGSKLTAPGWIDVAAGTNAGIALAIANSVTVTTKVPISGRFNGQNRSATLTILP